MADEVEFVPESVRDELSYRQARNLEIHYQQYREWLRTTGKNRKREVGFSSSSVDTKFHRTIRFHRWVWNQIGEITATFKHSYADQYEKALDEDKVRRDDGEPYSEGSKRKLQQAVVDYFRFGGHQLNGEPWSPNIEFSQTEHEQADYFTLAEREQLYEASLTYDDLGKYNDLSPDDREKRKQYLAQKLQKPKSQVTPDDFETSRTSWKIPSLVSVALDIGARPILIKRCQLSWYKPKKGVLQIPKEDSPKNDAYWEPSLSSRSIDVLNRWEPQRAATTKYSSSGHLWLNREGNPYRSGPLNHLLDKLIEEAEIDQSNRKLTWTSIRRSTGTYLAYFRSLAYAKQQLRHKSRQSTLRYVELPVEARKNALDQLAGYAIASPDLREATQTGQSSTRVLEVLNHD